MTNILLSGCNGHMGKVITGIVAERENCKICAGVDINTSSDNGYPVYSSFSEVKEKPDVIIDFSHPSVLDNLLDYATKNSVPTVISTTGFSKEQIDKIHKASEEVAIFFSFNMSLGINLLSQLAKTATKILGDNFDIEIVEMHHNQKIDAPSGTALMLADAISEELKNKPRYEYDRHSKRSKREKNEIGIHAVRGGTIVGEHEIIFAGHDEVIKLSHSAASKEVFAVGSVNAAIFLADEKAGLYSMSDLIAKTQN
ncbi:MAG: 4-hydroxy-tetrahydrodipicolinate reductase [Clostridiales bacterium]|nr:4-hydroxy-tetrahydrodipicolinate reductase [Clostridiales bacterium]